MTLKGALLGLALAYGTLWGGAQVLAPAFGRVPIPCTGEPLRMQSPLFCATLRNFVTPELRALARDAAATVAAQYPGTVTLALDGNLPVFDGVPLIPHLSHDDGEKLDFAFYYMDDTGTYLPGRTASPIGYFAFERVGTDVCGDTAGPMRWEMRWFEPLTRDLALEPARTAALVRALLDDPRSGKLFLEPPLAQALGLDHPRLRFAGCGAARHDDHIHLEL
ncbi:MAG: hypothetical protein HLUCCA08_01765 [Rhodobacteraceae bacterium HLUCCA08]|nr:MAG: hypothetical protein HLUCCA08_01765 [Rhodobacteraceae bacterium HLUCCA08]